MPNPDYPALIKRPLFVLDFDAYVQTAHELRESLHYMEQAHTCIQGLFEESITEDFGRLCMPDPQHLFSSEYSEGSHPTEADEGSRPSPRPTEADEGEAEQGLSQTGPGQPTDFTPLKFDIKPKIYGTGKPCRIVIRGKISRE
jgi:hypothetical protein